MVLLKANKDVTFDDFILGICYFQNFIPESSIAHILKEESLSFLWSIKYA